MDYVIWMIVNAPFATLTVIGFGVLVFEWWRLARQGTETGAGDGHQ